MTQHPLALQVVETPKGTMIKASTSLEKAVQDPERLQDRLRCIEIRYRATLAAIKECLACAGKGTNKDPRAYWFAGMYMAQFLETVETMGFYVLKKNITLAKHLGISRASVEKMIAFYKRYSDPAVLDMSIPWTAYRDNKELSWPKRGSARRHE